MPSNKIPQYILIFFLVVVFGGTALKAWLEGDVDDAQIIFAIGVGLFALYCLDTYIQRNMQQIADFLKNFGLIPKPTEASMFVTALTATLLLISGSDVWTEIVWFIESDEKGRPFGILIYILIGIGLSVYHAFSQRAKTQFEQEVMKWYVAVTAVAIAVSSAVFIYFAKQPGFLVFTTWSSIQALAIIFFSGKNHMGEFISLPRRNARLAELILGVGVVVIVLSIERMYFNTHWSIAFSTVLAFWAIFDNYFENTLWYKNSQILGRKRRLSKQ